MQPINYDQVLLTFQCQRKHLFIDSKYYVQLLPKLLILSSNPKQKDPKYIVELNLNSRIHWITKGKTPILEQFGFQYKDKIKYFCAKTKDLQQLKNFIQGKIIQKDINDFYSPNRLLGIGVTSKVYLVTKKDDQSKFASKCIDKQYFQKNEEYNAQFNEILIMQKLKHDNIVQLTDIYVGENTFYLILEYLEGKSLDEIFQYQQSNFEQEQIQIIIKLILQAIDYMHSEGVMHRDLKPENIMFKQTNNLQSLKIVDFGLATFQNIDVFPYPRCGTPGYVAPEIANLQDMSLKYDVICDEFSVGCIFYKLCTGKEIFPGNDYKEIMKLNMKCEIILDTLTLYNTPPEAVDLISQLLKVDPKERITAQNALQHSYFQQQYHNKMNLIQQSNLTNQNQISQTQNFSPKVLSKSLQNLIEDNVEEEEENKIQLNILNIQNKKSSLYFQKNAYIKENPNPLRKMKIFHTLEFGKTTQKISQMLNNFKPTLIKICEENDNDIENQVAINNINTKNNFINKSQVYEAINYIEKNIEKQQNEKGIQT
ncbi:unnamed protein product [Paramecium sonneborni]|uniref:Protein kinase domain-containing protein n=1 Tax=Paramecium sonneborni TaxID=65129 RepID=A0A8S1QMD7_9CILI|nr:unnamed protein product [Paramecium sonneborni]